MLMGRSDKNPQSSFAGITFFFQALFIEKSLDEFWLSVYKSYSMIVVKVIKIMLLFVSSWLYECEFSTRTKIKTKKRETFWN